MSPHYLADILIKSGSAIRNIRHIVILSLVQGTYLVAGTVSLDENKNGQSTESGKGWSGDIGVDLVSSFFNYGVLQENKGAIAQTYVDVSRTVFQGDGFVTNVTLGLELWTSLHSAETGATKDSKVPQWYEFDYFLPLSVTLAKRSIITLTYFEFYSPNGAFSPVRAGQVNLAFDDEPIFHSVAMHPHITVLYNFRGVISIDRSDAWYYELGISPGLVVNKKGSYPLTLKLPLTLGLGDGHFYPGDAYGYFSAAINGSMPLKFLPKSFGCWAANAGFTYYNLGSATAEVSANRDENAYVAQIGFLLDF